jgi:hypothetical protein
MAGKTPQVLSYEVPGAAREIPGLDRMLFWRMLASWGIGAIIAGLFFTSWVVLIGGVAWFLIASAWCFIYMTSAAAAEVGTLYAARQLLLAIVLLPMLFTGVLVVPLLVQADLLNWRARDDEIRKDSAE